MATKEEKDKAYADGVKDGKNDNSLGDIVQGLGLGSSFSMSRDLRDIYDKGHDFGRGHRYESSSKDKDSKSEESKPSSEKSDNNPASEDNSIREYRGNDRDWSEYSSYPIMTTTKSKWSAIIVSAIIIGIVLAILSIFLVLKYQLITPQKLCQWGVAIVIVYFLAVLPLTVSWKFIPWSIAVVLIAIAAIFPGNAVITLVGLSILLIALTGLLFILAPG